MFNLLVDTIEGQKECVVYNVKDVPIKDIEEPYYLDKIKNVEYSNIVATFDIETTTIIPENSEDSPYGFMYHWQFCLNGVVVFGRYWHEFRYFLYKLENYYRLSANRRIVVYVHFLSFEFQFFNQIVPIDEIFATDKRKVLTCRSGGIEFRCSYRLSNKSLEKFCEDTPECVHRKLTPKLLEKLKKKYPEYKNYTENELQFDYKKIRTPMTILTRLEKSYCYNDVYGLYECVKSLLKDDTIKSIPLTSTGYVRREVRKNCQEWNYRKNFMRLSLNSDMYKLLKDMFRGGNCHANSFFTNKIVDNVKSKDKQSSYIASIMYGYYPMDKLTKVNVENAGSFNKYLKRYCCMFRCKFVNIRCKRFTPVPYIDLGHCLKYSNITLENGRVVDADMVTIALTEIDWNIIYDTYKFDSFEITDMYVSKRGKIPKEIRSVMMDYYYKKTTLKGIVEQLYFYIKAKNNLNAFYGMMVTAIAHILWSYLVDTADWESEEEDVKEALERFFSSRSNFLAYQWGIYVTADSRKELQYGIDIVGNDIVYVDTDAVKYINGEKYEKEFNRLNNRLIRMAHENDLPGYVEFNGDKYYLGFWEDEKTALRFKTLGAKKYCGEYEEDGKKELKITVSGMNKEKGARAVGTIENFKIGKTYKDVGRTVSYYNDEKKHFIDVNGEHFLSAGNIGVVDTTYTLGVTNEYWEYFNKVQIEGIAKIDN